MADYQNPTPGSKTMPRIQSDNNQGQGSAYKGSSSMFQPKVPLQGWPPANGRPAPGDK